MAAAAAAIAPAAAHADSLVYVKSGQVNIARVDGTHAKRVTKRANNWAWPSISDGGTIVVAGGRQRVNPDGSDSSGSTELYRMSQKGKAKPRFTPTPGSYSTPSCPTFAPQMVRVSPDGRHVAYTIFECDTSHTFVTPSNTTRLSASRDAGTDFDAPYWIDNGRLLLTHLGPTITEEQPAVGVFTVSDGGFAGWIPDPGFLSGRQAVISRSGTKMAVLQDDAADQVFGDAQHAQITLYTQSAVGAGDVTAGCTLNLDASKLKNPTAASPSFSPDGNRLAFGMSDGVHIANVANLANCATVTQRLAIRGASFPSYGKAKIKRH